MQLKDMTEIVAPAGSVLILQPHVDMSSEQWGTLRAFCNDVHTRTGLPIIAVPHDCDIHVIALQEALPPQTDVTHLVGLAPVEDQDELFELYNHGTIVQWRTPNGSDWYDAHLVVSPLPEGQVELRRKVK